MNEAKGRGPSVRRFHVAAVAFAACLCSASGPAFAEGEAAKLGAPAASDAGVDLSKVIDGVRAGTLTPGEVKSMGGAAVGDALSYFAGRNDAEAVKRLITLGASPDQPNSFGTNALTVAIGEDSLAAASALVAAGADPKARTDRNTPLEYAGKVGSAEMKGLLGGRVPDGGERLRSAARKGDLAAIRELSKSNVDLNSADGEGVTPLLDAAQAGNIDAVSLLLTLGADPEGSPKAEVTPLAAAIVLGDAAVAKALLDAKANPDRKVQGVPALTLAVAAGRREIVDLLLAAHADKTIKGDDGSRPADVAAAMGQSSLTEELGGSSAFRPAMNLFAAIQAKDGDKVQAALDAGADPNQKNAEGYPALVYAAAFGDNRSVQKLLRAGADPLAVGPGGVSAITAAYARKEDRLAADAIARSLLEDRPHLARQLLALKDGNGRSAAVVMAAHAKSTYVNPYVDALAEPQMGRNEAAQLANTQDGDGISPLAAAVMADNYIVVRGFIDAGAPPGEAKGSMSLQDLARARGSWKALAVLPSDRVLPDGLKKGASPSVKKEFQSLLSQWGYYKGKVDGTFGKTSRAAAIAFFKDRGKDIRKLAEAGAAFRRENPGASPGEIKFDLYWQGRGDNCSWKVAEWNPKESTASSSFVGCVKGSDVWNANGIGYVAYANGSEEIRLFGDGGWEGDSELK